MNEWKTVVFYHEPAVLLESRQCPFTCTGMWYRFTPLDGRQKRYTTCGCG